MPTSLVWLDPGSVAPLAMVTEPMDKVPLMVCPAPVIGKEPETVAEVLIPTTAK